MALRPVVSLVTIDAIESASASWTGTTTAASSRVLRSASGNFQCPTMVRKFASVVTPSRVKASTATSTNG